MRLLNTRTLTLHTFFDKTVPDYAILSHRWEDEEVTFQDLQSGRGSGMPGYAKIEGCCAQAKSDGWEYAWIDACCIDKSSSAELSEAINSMFKWYKNSRVCYAYLSDVDGKEDIPKQLRRSAWLTRGWTLQELLAPETVVFFDRNWADIGSKSSLEDVISNVTRIRDLFAWKECCVAEKMSWASLRHTTRVEDEAYCLMGLFDVNMPLLYGEGRKAFQRLQLEILKSSDDDSLFCWYAHYHTRGDMLASSPAAFKLSSSIRHYSRKDSILNSMSDLYRDPREYFHRKAYPTTSSNKGLHISLFLIPILALDLNLQVAGPEIVYVALLQGLEHGTKDHSPAILLRRYVSEAVGHAINRQDWTCARIKSDKIFSLDLQRTEVQCENWMARKRLSFHATSPTPSKPDDHLYPRSRIIYVKADPSESWVSKWQNRIPYDILLDASSLQNNSFAISSPIPVDTKEEEVSSNISAWKTNMDPLRLSYRPSTHRGPRYFHVYFTNHTTKETLLYLVFVEISGRASLLLLKLNTDRTFKNLSVPSLLDETPLMG